MKTVLLILLEITLLCVIGSLAFYDGSNRTETAMQITIDEQTDRIRDLVTISEAYDQLNKEYLEYKEKSEMIAALSPLEDIMSEDEIIELIKEIPHGSPFRCTFSVTAPFGESIGYHGALRDDHQGDDLTPDYDDWTVTPISEGRVEQIGIDDIYGKFVYIRHSKRVRSFYAHGEKIFYSANVGQQVTDDTKIMVMGETGLADGPHLHFELQIYTGKAWISIDPLVFIRG